MFRAVKLKNLKTAALVLTGGLLLTVICLFALRAGTPDTIELNGRSYSLTVKSESDIARFLSACGYPDAALLSKKEITVPISRNGVYTRYIELQRQQGFDLESCSGKAAIEYVYAVSETRSAAVLVHDHKIVAAHLCDIDGSDMRPLL